MMKFERVVGEEAWEEIIASWSEANFLQSWYWGDFHRRLGKEVVRVVVREGKVVAAVAQAVLEPAKRGSYLAIAGGPLYSVVSQKYFDYLMKQLSAIGKDLGAKFIRFRPQLEKNEQIMQRLKDDRYQVSPMHLTADLTVQLDLALESEAILASMRKNTRYDIRRSEKLGIVTSVSTDVTEIAEFYKTQLQLAKRHGFVPFSENFLRTQFEVFAEAGKAALIHAHSAEGELLASAFIIFYNQEAVYHYGVSTVANQKLPGSYACQWRAIQEAKARGCTRYNLWGVAPHNQPEHRFAGVSIFKRGFGGREVEYVPAHDLPLSKSYFLTRGFEALRKRYRRL